MMRCRPFGLAVVMAAGMAISGCGGSGLPPLIPVSGQVTLDGKPLPTGLVQFVPDASKNFSGPTCTGGIDSNGKFTITTISLKNNQPLPGAPAGHYKIGIVAQGPPRSREDSMPPSLIPLKYNNPDSSGFTIEVKAGAAIDFPLPLKSEPTQP